MGGVGMVNGVCIGECGVWVWWGVWVGLCMGSWGYVGGGVCIRNGGVGMVGVGFVGGCV